jgi:hypothetical protein
MEPKRKPKAGLSLVALAFASLFWVPLLPLVGMILGGIALATRRARTPALIAVCLGGAITVVSGVVGAVSISAFRRAAEGARIAEANMQISAIAKGLRELDEPAWRALADADWTPAGPVCVRRDHRLADDGSAWQVAPWSTLGFAMQEPHVYQYRLRRDGDAFVVEARADLDCQGRISEVSARVVRGSDDFQLEHRLH